MRLALVDTFEQKGSTSPLGLISIATYLREKNSDVDVTIVDCAFEDAVTKLRGIHPDAIGISAYTYKYNSAVQLAR